MHTCGCAGLPGLYLYGLVWLVVVDVVDRWYLCRMCQRPVRYGKNLPYMLLGRCCLLQLADLLLAYKLFSSHRTRRIHDQLNLQNEGMGSIKIHCTGKRPFSNSGAAHHWQWWVK